MTERVNYNAQVNQMPIPYYYPQSGSSKKKYGLMVAGGLIGMNAYYLPIKKDVFVQRAFDMTRNEIYDQIRTLKNIAEEVDKNEVSTQSKMILQEFGLSENRDAITNKCIELDKKVSDPVLVKRLKDSFITSFDNCKKKTHLMDSVCADAYKAAKWNKFKWGVGIGSAIGLAIGLIGSRE